MTFARLDFWCFVELMFAVLYPGQKLVYTGYLELIATLLMRVGQRKFCNVIINLPPRHMKSALASILYPAWRLGCDPTVKFICISYGDDLAHDLSAQTRKVMRSPLYKLIFPGTILDKSAVDHRCPRRRHSRQRLARRGKPANKTANQWIAGRPSPESE